MIRNLLITLILTCLLGFSFAQPTSIYNAGKFINAQIKDTQVNLEVVEQERDWYNGLSNRTNLCPNCGMLFNFFKSSDQTFVMREMNFPLDIVWLNHGLVTGISADLPAEHVEPYTPYPSPSAVDEVIELPSGFAAQHGIHVGDTINLYESLK